MSSKNSRYSIVLHAGAAESWHGNAESHRNSVTFLEALIERGEADLRNGAVAVDVVTEITAALEDFPDFNAGKGSALNQEGFHELEAAVIDGKTCEYRAVAGLRRTKNPVRLAKSMLSSAGLCFLAGTAADDLAARNGLEMVNNSYYTTSKRKSYWDANVAKINAATEGHGTVGAAALDVYGNLAVANSTGGTMFKSVGRIGDTAIVGAGIYADDEVAIVCGSGEAILKATVASRAVSNMSGNACLSDAIKRSVLRSAQLFPTSSCGVIAVNREGDISIHCNSRIFAIASAGSNISTRAGVIRSTIPLLTQHVFFADESLTIGMAKYPTMPCQVTAELKHTSAVAVLGLASFLDVFSKLRVAAKVLKNYSASNDCGLVLSTPTEAQIYPFTLSPDSIKSGASLETAQSSIKSVISTAHQLNETIAVESRILPENQDILARIDLVSTNICSSVDMTSLPSKAFLDLIKLIWESLQVLVVKHNMNPTSLGLKLEPVFREGLLASVFHSDSSLGVPLENPRPAPFHLSYPGYMATGLGLRAQNLEELPSIARELSARMDDAINEDDIVLML